LKNMMPMRTSVGSMNCEAETTKSDAWRGYKGLPSWIMEREVIGFLQAKPYRRWTGENVHLSAHTPFILPCHEKLGSWGKSDTRSSSLMRAAIGMREITTQKTRAARG
jgi:hypothetical protein